MYDVITIGSATQDVFMKSRDFRILKHHAFTTGEAQCFALGSKIEIDDVIFDTGGGGTNGAVAFSRLGFSTAFLGKINQDAAGREIIRVLRKEKVATHLIIKDRKIRTGVSVVLLAPTGERTILVFRGAAAQLSPDEIVLSKLETKWFYITSVAGNFELLEKLVNFAAKKGIKVAMNPGIAELEQKEKLLKVLKKVDVLLLNREEAAQVSGENYKNTKNIFRKICFLIPGISVITDGRKGAFACDRKNQYQIGAYKIKVVDATGAGDSFGAGFVAGLIL
jgi:ribokinase